MTIQRKIRLRPDEIKDFVQAACNCDFDIDISSYYNHYVVDAKSILGVLGMDLNRDLTVSYDGYNEAFESFLKKLNCACA